jgi:hypothetical protein
MNRNWVRVLLVVTMLGAEGFLVLLGLVFGLSATDSGLHEWDAAGFGVFVEMLLLLLGGLACIVASRSALQFAAVLGIALLVVGVVVDVVSYAAFQNDVSSGKFIVGLLLPAAIVLGGVWLMGRVNLIEGREAEAQAEQDQADDATSWESYGLGVWRIRRCSGLPGMEPGDALGIDASDDEVMFFKPDVGRVASAALSNIRVAPAEGNAVYVASSDLHVLLVPIRADPAALLALAPHGVGGQIVES